MSNFPSWNSLKHFNHVATISFTDGQSFYDILKVNLTLPELILSEKFQCILPCIMQLLPRNSSLIHCIRAYQCYRLMIGLRCMTDRRLKQLKKFIKDYEKYCSVSKTQIITVNVLIYAVSVVESIKRIRKKLRLFQTTLCFSYYYRYTSERDY